MSKKRRTLRIFFVLLLYWPVFGFAGEPRAFHEQSLQFAAQIKETLINFGYCASISECSKKDMVFLTNKEDGFLVSVYGVHGKDVTSELVDKLYSFYSKHQKTMTLSMEVYLSDYSDVPKIYFFKNPYLSIRLPAYVEASSS